MTTQPTQPPAAAQDICGYPVQSWLTPDRTALCASGGGRLLVLQRLPEECLQGAQLHASVRERLTRVKELAHRQVASFTGVERDRGDTWLVWQYVEGTSLHDYLADPSHSPREVLLMLRELMLAVEGLHALGIVHGAIHGQNVIIAHTGDLRLTHISPLLHQETDVDYDALAMLLQQVMSTRTGGETRLSRLITQKIARRTSMLELASEISRLVDAPQDDAGAPVADPSGERKFRKKALYSAVGCAAAAALIAVVAYLLLAGRGDAPQRPPEAPAALLRPK